MINAISDDVIQDHLDIEHLNGNMRRQLRNLVETYKPVKPEIYPVKMKIILTDDIPVTQRPRRMSHSVRNKK